MQGTLQSQFSVIRASIPPPSPSCQVVEPVPDLDLSEFIRASWFVQQQQENLSPRTSGNVSSPRVPYNLRRSTSTNRRRRCTASPPPTPSLATSLCPSLVAQSSPCTTMPTAAASMARPALLRFALEAHRMPLACPAPRRTAECSRPGHRPARHGAMCAAARRGLYQRAPGSALLPAQRLWRRLLGRRCRCRHIRGLVLNRDHISTL